MDPYVYPGTNVLRNLRDIRDAELLSRFEAIATTRRSIELEDDPIQASFEARHLFKSGDPFAFHQHIVSSLDKVCAELTSERHLAGADPERFACRGAYYLGEINAIHPFREGNGRAQRGFIGQLAVSNGLAIDWTQVSREEMIEASRLSLRVNNTGLEELLKKALGKP